MFKKNSLQQQFWLYISYSRSLLLLEGFLVFVPFGISFPIGQFLSYFDKIIS